MLVEGIYCTFDEFRRFKAYVIVSACVDTLPQFLPFFLIEVVLHEVSLCLVATISWLEGIGIEYLVELLLNKGMHIFCFSKVE